MNDTSDVPGGDRSDATVPAILARGLRKSFAGRGGTREAVRGVDLTVRAGEIFSLLGPNGAGKTTTMRMLTTLLPIDRGSAEVAGIDVARRPHEVRRRIGYVGQLGGADLAATGRENLRLQAQLYGLSSEQAARRADELVELLALGEFVDRIARTYSGGQRRRLEVALGIVHRPEVLFLDEPTSGLDPQNRANLWDHVRALRASGTTVVLVTHYLEEADEGETLRLYVSDGAAAIPAVVELLRAQGVPLAGIALGEASLDDVFLRQTGRSLRDAGPADPQEAAA